MLISKQTTLRGSWRRKLQSSCVHDQNANTSQIFLLALFQMKYKSFMNHSINWKLMTNLETRSEANWWQIETGTANIKGATKKNFFCIWTRFQKKIRPLVRSNHRNKTFFFYLFKVLHNGRMRLIQSQNITGCTWWSHNKQAFNVQYDRKRIKLQL